MPVDRRLTGAVSNGTMPYGQADDRRSAVGQSVAPPGSRDVATCSPSGPDPAGRLGRMETDRATFERLVADALDQIPESLGRLIEDVVVLVEDWPTAEQLAGRHGTLLGLYQGIDLTRRSPLSLCRRDAGPHHHLPRSNQPNIENRWPSWWTWSPRQSSMRWPITSESPMPVWRSSAGPKHPVRQS